MFPPPKVTIRILVDDSTPRVVCTLERLNSGRYLCSVSLRSDINCDALMHYLYKFHYVSIASFNFPESIHSEVIPANIVLKFD